MTLTTLLSSRVTAHAQQLTTLYSFTNTTDGQGPVDAPLTIGSDGNLYGVTPDGGTGQYGTVFQLTPGGAFKTLYSFTNGADGGSPHAGVTEGTAGTFYGVTAQGGDANSDGTLFSITSGGAFTVLHTFSEFVDGAAPGFTTLVRDSSGNLYGSTSVGGNGNIDTGMNIDGTVFQLTPTGTFSTIFYFNENGQGGTPVDLIVATDGNLYGVCAVGGANGQPGTIFRLSSAGGLTTLYSFPENDEFDQEGGLTQGTDGNFYGTTSLGGANGNGMVYQITAAGAFTDLHDFSATSGGAQNAANSDGATPYHGVIQGSDGNFYGTASAGGSSGDGTIYRITSTGVFTTLYNFRNTTDGYSPKSALIQDGSGNLYGTTEQGGSAGVGTIFKLALTGGSGHTAFFTGETALANGVYYLAFPNGNYFGYYSYLTNPAYLYHFDLGYEYVFDAADGKDGVYFYDFSSNDFFYTSPSFPFPYLYDFGLQSTLYYYPDPNNAGHYNTNGVRYFYVFSTGAIISK